MTTRLAILPGINRHLPQVFDQNYFGLVGYGCRFGLCILDFRNLPPIILDNKIIHNGHRGKVLSISFCKVNNINLVATIGEDKQLKIWDLDKCSCIAELETKECARIVEWLHGTSDSVVFPDVYGCITKWNFRTNNNIKMKSGSDVKVVVLSSNYKCSELLAAGHSSGVISILNVVNQVLVHKLRAHTMDISSLSWSLKLPDVLLSSSFDQSARLWKLGEENAIKTYHFPSSRSKSEDKRNVKVCAMCHPEDPDVIICSNVRGDLGAVAFKEKSSKFTSYSTKSWDSNYKTVTIMQPFFDKTTDEKVHMFLSCDNFKLSIWDISRKRVISSFPFLVGAVYDLKLSALQPNLLAVCSGDGVMKIWNQNSEEEIVTIYVHYRVKITTAAWHPIEDHLLAYGIDEGRVGIIDILKKKSLYSFETHHNGAVYSLQWGPCCKIKESEKLFLYSCGGGTIHVHEPNNQNEQSPDFDTLVKLPSDLETVASQRSEITWKSDYTCLAVGSYKGYIDIFSNELTFLGRVIVQIKTIENMRWHPILTLASPSGSPYKSWIAVVGNDENIHIINISNIDAQSELCKSTKTLIGHKKKISSICWSQHTDGLLVSASKDGTVQVWNVCTNKLIANYQWHRDMVHAVCWSATDSDIIFSGGADSCVRIWNISEQTETSPPSKSIVIKNKPKFKQICPSAKKAQPIMAEPPESSCVSQNLQIVATENENTSPATKAKETHAKSSIRDKSMLKLFDPGSDFFFKRNGNLNSVLLRKYSKEESLETVFKLVDHLSAKLDDNKESSVERNNNLSPEDIEKIGLFGDQNNVLKLLTDKAHAESNLKSWYLHLMAGNVKPMICEAAEKKKLNEFLVAVSPSVSIKFWHEMCEKYAIQLVEEEQYLRASLYFTMCGKLMEGLNLLIQQGRTFEALALAKARLPETDPLLQDILGKAFKYFCNQHQIENQAACHLAMKQPLQAAKTLYCVADSKYIYAAVYICCKYNLKEEAEAYAYFCMENCLSQNDYQTFNSLVELVESLKVYMALIRVHELLWSYFKVLKREDGLLANDIFGVNESKVKIWSGRLCGELQQSFIAYAYNTLVMEEIINPGDKESVAELHKALDLMDIKRRKFDESAEVHICVAMFATKSIVALLQEDSDLVKECLNKIFLTSHKVAFLPKVVSWLFLPLDIYYEKGVFICDSKVSDLEVNCNYQMLYKYICDRCIQVEKSNLDISSSFCDISPDSGEKFITAASNLSKKSAIDSVLLFFFFSYLDELRRLVKKGWKFKCYDKIKSAHENGIAITNSNSLVSGTGSSIMELKSNSIVDDVDSNSTVDDELKLKHLIETALKEADTKARMILEMSELAEDSREKIKLERKNVVKDSQNPEVLEFIQSVLKTAEEKAKSILESQNRAEEQVVLHDNNGDIENVILFDKNVPSNISEHEVGTKDVKENCSEEKLFQDDLQATPKSPDEVSTNILGNESHSQCWADVNLSFMLTNFLNDFLCRNEYAVFYYLENYLDCIDAAISSFMKKQSSIRNTLNVSKVDRKMCGKGDIDLIGAKKKNALSLNQTHNKIVEGNLGAAQKDKRKPVILTEDSNILISERKTHEKTPETINQELDDSTVLVDNSAFTVVKNYMNSGDKFGSSFETSQEIIKQNLHDVLFADNSDLIPIENYMNSEYQTIEGSSETVQEDINSVDHNISGEKLNMSLVNKNLGSDLNVLDYDGSSIKCTIQLVPVCHEKMLNEDAFLNQITEKTCVNMQSNIPIQGGFLDQLVGKTSENMQSKIEDNKVEDSSIETGKPIVDLPNGVVPKTENNQIDFRGESLTAEELQLRRRRILKYISFVKSADITYPNPFDAVSNILGICCDIIHKHPCEVVQRKFHETAHRVLEWKKVYYNGDKPLVCEICHQ